MHTLKDSKLTLENGILLKTNSDGSQVASIKLENIDKIFLKQKIDSTFVFLFLVFAASAVSSYLYMSNGWLKVCAIIVLGLISMMTLCAVKQTILVIKDRGDIVEFPISDSDEDAQAFMLMLNQQRNHF